MPEEKKEEITPEVKVTPVVIISLTEKGQIVVQGPIANKKMALSILADAMKIVVNHEDPKSLIIQAKNILPH